MAAPGRAGEVVEAVAARPVAVAVAAVAVEVATAAAARKAEAAVGTAIAAAVGGHQVAETKAAAPALAAVVATAVAADAALTAPRGASLAALRVALRVAETGRAARPRSRGPLPAAGAGSTARASKRCTLRLGTPGRGHVREALPSAHAGGRQMNIDTIESIHDLVLAR